MPNKMTIYIAGPMSGIQQYNYPLFDQVAAYCRRAWPGAEIINPADVDRKTYHFVGSWPFGTVTPEQYAEAMDRARDGASKCTTIVLLPGWEKSNGARIELECALTAGAAVRTWQEARHDYGPWVRTVGKLAAWAMLNAANAEAERVAAEVAKADHECDPNDPNDPNDWAEVSDDPTPQPATALRANTGKPELAQLFQFRLDAIAAHCSAGRAKYPDAADGTPNWKLGGKPDQEYLDSAARHIESLVRGETYDSETRTMHAAAVAWNMLALITNNYANHPATEGGAA